ILGKAPHHRPLRQDLDFGLTERREKRDLRQSFGLLQQTSIVVRSPTPRAGAGPFGPCRATSGERASSYAPKLLVVLVFVDRSRALRCLLLLPYCPRVIGLAASRVLRSSHPPRAGRQVL